MEPALMTTQSERFPPTLPYGYGYVYVFCVCVCLWCSLCLLCFTAQESMKSCRGSGCLVSAGEDWYLRDGS